MYHGIPVPIKYLSNANIVEDPTAVLTKEVVKTYIERRRFELGVQNGLSSNS
jgi:hypothetical protein